MKTLTSIVAGITALGIAGTAVAAPKFSGEAFQYATPENRGGTLYEIKASTSALVGPLEVRLFERARETVGGPTYIPKHFMNNELSLGYEDFHLLGQARIADGKVTPQTGFSYEPAFTLGPISGKLIVAATATVESQPMKELLVPVALTLPTTSDQYVSVLVEQVVLADKRDAQGSTHGLVGSSKVHVGYGVGLVTLGVAAETDYGTRMAPHPRIGGFVKFTGK